MKYIKSCLNYTGGKYKLLPQIMPLFPEDINMFVDLFCGGCNVGINVNAKKIVCNDIENHVISLLNYFKNNDLDNVINNIEKKIIEYGFSETSKNGYEYYGTNSSDGVAYYNKDKYFKLRNDYNNNLNNDLLFYLTVIFSFSNQIRFNKDNKFNMPVNKRDFNDNLKNNTINFINEIHNKNIFFTNNDFKELKIEKLKEDDFVYCDPPYLITCASYNEQDGWNETKEKQLLKLLDSLNDNNIKFALSNVLENKGKRNEILIEWCKKYNVHYLNNSYSNCNYHAKDKSKNSTVEVLITNY